MPTYEYECETCGHVFEHVQPMSARPLKSFRCERCKRTRKVKRLIGPGAALLFKGSGFYQTDYRSESYKKAAESESGKGKEAGKESTGSSSEKPAAETSPKPKSKDAGETGKPGAGKKPRK